jgi:hypothetical protein
MQRTPRAFKPFGWLHNKQAAAALQHAGVWELSINGSEVSGPTEDPASA